jgi:hypothetical protein
MSADFIDKMINVLSINNLINSDLRGCSTRDIDVIKQCQCVEYLPDLYIQFLLKMGKNAGGCLYSDTEYSYESLITMKQYAISTFHYSGFWLPVDAFVFMLLPQGTGCMYFHTASKDDVVPIYLYDAGTPMPEIKYPSLEEHYQDMIKIAKIFSCL